VNTNRLRNRLTSVIAGTAFVAAGVFASPVAALAADHHTSDHAGAAIVTVADNNPAAAPAPAGNAGAPSDTALHPMPVTAEQQTATPSVDQVRNAKAIVDAGKAMNLSPRAWEIAVATSLQETNLRNIGDLGDANDHDSLGLFQQRPSSGWGTPDQLTDPAYAATAFYKALVQVPGWDHLVLTDAAQKVQVSAFADAYAKHETQAGNIINALYGTGPYTGIAQGLK
jgi:hypothetical protein